MKWVWQHPDWPRFAIDEHTFDERTDAFRLAAERLSGSIWALGDERRDDAHVELMLSEAIATSAIEGEHLDRDSVRSSLLARFGKLEAETHNDLAASGAAALIVDVRRNWNRSLSHALLARWQEMVIPEAPTNLALRGMYRTGDVSIVSGYAGRHRIHYVAPPADRIPAEMERFLDWYNGDSTEYPGPVRATLAHLWFETIHPFEDGNGRVGRAIADHALSQSLDRPTLACLSTAIAETRKSYYRAFERFNRAGRLDATDFAYYFTGAVVRAQEIALAEVGFVLAKSRFFDQHRDGLNTRQTKALNRMFAAGRAGFEGGMSVRKYVAITKCAPTTATRDLQALRAMDAMVSRGAGRSTRYDIVHRSPSARTSPPRDR